MVIFIFSSYQELQSQLEFIQSLTRDLHQRCQALPLEVPDAERNELKDKLQRLQREVSELDEEIPRASQYTAMVTPGREGASAVVELPPEVVQSKPAAHEPTENADSDLGDSESGVSSMESFEGILRKENGHTPGENGVRENGVLEERSANEDSDENVHSNEGMPGGMSVTPDEYQRIRMNQSAETNENESMPSVSPIGVENGQHSRDLDDESRETDDKSRAVSVPLLTVTDEDGTPAEVTFAENTPENSLDDSFPDQAGQFFIDDFDVYYGQASPKKNIEPEEATATDNTVASESERDEPDNVTAKETADDYTEEMRANDMVNGSQNSSLSDQAPSGVSNDRTSEVRDQQLTDNTVTESVVPSHKTITDDALRDFDISADLETGDNVPRHSTPSELVSSTDKDGNAPLDQHAEAPELLTDSSVPPEKSLNGDAVSTASNRTPVYPQFGESGQRIDKKRKYEPLEGASRDSQDLSGQTGIQTGLVSSAPNEELDKLDRLLNIRESQNSLREDEVQTPQDRIASILSQRRKAEEAERLRFAEDSVRDTDYELFTSRPLDLVDRSSPLKELDESGTLLHEDMTLDEFLVEVEKLVEKLRSIEELITTDMDSEDNVKDELAKHVVSWRTFCCTSRLQNSPYFSGLG